MKGNVCKGNGRHGKGNSSAKKAIMKKLWS